MLKSWKETEPRIYIRLFVTIRLLGGGDSAGVDSQLGVSNDLLDAALSLEIGKRLSGEGAVDLETIDEGSDRDQAVRLDILLELVVGLLVENDGVVGLVLDCGLCQWRSLDVNCRLRKLRARLTLLCYKGAVSSFRGTDRISGCAQSRGSVGGHIPLPLDHFFFCFLAPVFAGAILSMCWVVEDAKAGFKDESS
jgi:hypothetical protein